MDDPNHGVSFEPQGPHSLPIDVLSASVENMRGVLSATLEGAILTLHSVWANKGGVVLPEEIAESCLMSRPGGPETDSFTVFLDSS